MLVSSEQSSTTARHVPAEFCSPAYCPVSSDVDDGARACLAAVGTVQSRWTGIEAHGRHRRPCCAIVQGVAPISLRARVACVSRGARYEKVSHIESAVDRTAVGACAERNLGGWRYGKTRRVRLGRDNDERAGARTTGVSDAENDGVVVCLQLRQLCFHRVTVCREVLGFAHTYARSVDLAKPTWCAENRPSRTPNHTLGASATQKPAFARRRHRRSLLPSEAQRNATVQRRPRGPLFR